MAPMTPPRPRRTPRSAPAQVSPRKSDGQQLRDELSKDGDSFSVRTLIAQAADIADLIEKLRAITSGDASTLVTLKLGTSQVVQITVDSPVRERRQLAAELRHLLAEIHRQRADVPKEPDDDDVLAGLDDD